MKGRLMRIRKSFRNVEKGFTLVEMLIVIVILSILALGLVPNLLKFTKNGTVGAANAELTTVRTAVAAYRADNQTLYPCVDQPSESVAQTIVTAEITPYTNSETIVGIYTVDGNGTVSGVSYPDLTWDTSNMTWMK
jgi:prepilin-type N-terminal cleavage/methylation domain-containing protein